MNYVIIGSYALKNHFSDYPNEPKDIDIVQELTSYISFEPTKLRVEIHQVDSELFRQFYKHSIDGLLSADGLYTLKVSHVPWLGKNGKWWKHMKDIKFLRNKGCKLIPEFHQSLIELWKKKFDDKSHINFSKNTYDFFTDRVERKFDHDWLHEYFMIEDVPAYTRILKSPDTALCSEEKFDDLSHEHKIHTILEEVFVLSTERNTSFNEMYKRIVTGMSKGFWNTFIIEHVEEILDGHKDLKTEMERKRKLLYG